MAREHAELYRPRWNVAPTDGHWIVRSDETGKRRMQPARFGFNAFDGQLIINALSARSSHEHAASSRRATPCP